MKSRNLDSQNFGVKFALVKHEREILLISSDYYIMIDKRDKSISTLHHRKKLSGGISHYKIARYIDGITSRDSNHLPHDSFRSSSANEKSVHLGIIKNLSIKFQTNVLSGFEVT